MKRDQDQQAQRGHLLASLFGTDVPSGLDGPLLRTTDVAALFQVSERTVSDWARRGRIPSVRTPGGHRRYPAEEILRLLRQSEQHPEQDAEASAGGRTGGDRSAPSTGSR